MFVWFIEAFNRFVQIYFIVRIIAPLLGFAFAIFWVRRTDPDAPLYIYIFNIVFWVFAFEVILFTISFYLAFMPPIPIPGVDPVYVFAGVLIIALTSGSFLFIIGLKKTMEAAREEAQVIEKELEGEEAIHVMIIGDEPHELPPDERTKRSNREGLDDFEE